MVVPPGTAILQLPHHAAEGGARRRHARFRLPSRAVSVAEARRRVREELWRWGFSDEVCDTATLVISELVTNAVVHTTGETVTCRLRAEGRRVHLHVADDGDGPGLLTARTAGPEEESGRGLRLVESLTDAWGVTTGELGGRTVWATLCQLGD